VLGDVTGNFCNGSDLQRRTDDDHQIDDRQVGVEAFMKFIREVFAEESYIGL
jgi:hypothetical protein